MYQTVIFDLDGTLLDTIADLTTAANAVCRENGWERHTVPEIQAMVGHGMENFIAKLSPTDAQSPEKRVETLDRFREFYAICLTEQTRPYPGMAELVEKLHRRGVRLAVCSNKDDAFCQILMNTFYPGRFPVVLGKRADLPPKPDPAMVRWVLRALDEKTGKTPDTEKQGTAGGKTLWAGDSATDIRTAHNAGLPVCAVTWGYRLLASLTEAGPEFLANSPEELEAVLLNG